MSQDSFYVMGWNGVALDFKCLKEFYRMKQATGCLEEFRSFQ